MEILKDRNLALYDIPSNGDCLFAAVCHQIPEKDVPQLRRECVENIKTLKDEYLPFLTHPKTGEMLTEAQFDEAAGEKDACYHKVKSRYDVWPSAYASGALVKCRKVGFA